MSDVQNTGANLAIDAKPIRLRDALRKARIEAADRTGVVRTASGRFGSFR